MPAISMPKSLYQQLSSSPSKKARNEYATAHLLHRLNPQRALSWDNTENGNSSFKSASKKRKRAPAKPMALKEDVGTCLLSKKEFEE
jgi:hypothetical protein